MQKKSNRPRGHFASFGCGLLVSVLLAAPCAQAWMEKWAPEFKSTPALVRKLSQKSVDAMVNALYPEEGEFRAPYSEGGGLDLNGDGIEDFVFLVPWMGCGLNAAGYTIHFIVSDGKGGRKKNVLNGYGAELSDLIKVGGKTYFRLSSFFEKFEKSDHNHWVFQLFEFDASGIARCANSEFGTQFPAVTIFYDNPKFRQVKLTAADRKKIEAETKPTSRNYVP